MSRFFEIVVGLVITIVVCSPVIAQDRPRNPVFAPVTDDPALPRVLILGDSISIGYTLAVRELLHDKANVHRAPENCGPTPRGLERLADWLGDYQWDVIHFNFGLHDLKYMTPDGNLAPVEEGKVQVPLDSYRENMTELVERLLKTNAQLVWCSTTPVPDGAKGRIRGDEIKYNKVAREVMDEVGGRKILINDLYAFAYPKLAEIQQRANVHFSAEGSKVLATEVARKIEEAIDLARDQPKLATGIVFHDANGNGKYDAFEKPLSGIRISNGGQIRKTGSDGRYTLPVDDDTILFVVKPRGWRTPLSEEKLPRFYYIHKPTGSPELRFAGVSPTGPLPASIDFPLYPQKEPEQFKAILFGDPQPRNKQEIDYIAHDVIEELIGTDASFGVTLGDILFDDLSLFGEQARTIAVLGIPWYNVIGNHDINYDAKDDKHSDETFEKHFGPSYYSFDYGPVHFLVLDNIEWLVEENGRGRYRGGLGKKQIEFVRNDLALIPDDQLLVLLMHIPLTSVNDRHDLYRLIEKRPFCMSVSGHTHHMEHRFITAEDGWQGPEPHHHVINVTVSGSWWSGKKDERGIPHTTMADGAPNGYSIISFDGTNYKLDFKAAGRSANYQMNIYAPNEISGNGSGEDIYVNVFNGSDRSKVEMRFNKGRWQLMDKVLREDPGFRKVYDEELALREKLLQQGVPENQLWRKLSGPKASSHLWHARLGPRQHGTHVLEVRATDMHGRKHIGRRTIRVK